MVLWFHFIYTVRFLSTVFFYSLEVSPFFKVFTVVLWWVRDGWKLHSATTSRLPRVIYCGEKGEVQDVFNFCIFHRLPEFTVEVLTPRFDLPSSTGDQDQIRLEDLPRTPVLVCPSLVFPRPPLESSLPPGSREPPVPFSDRTISTTSWEVPLARWVFSLFGKRYCFSVLADFRGGSGGGRKPPRRKTRNGVGTGHDHWPQTEGGSLSLPGPNQLSLSLSFPLCLSSESRTGCPGGSPWESELALFVSKLRLD